MTPSIYSGAFADLLTASRGQQPGWGMPGHPNHQPAGRPGMTDPPMGSPGMVAQQNMTPQPPATNPLSSSLLHNNGMMPTPPQMNGQSPDPLMYAGGQGPNDLTNPNHPDYRPPFGSQDWYPGGGMGGQMPGYPGIGGGFGWGGMFGFPQMPNNRPAFSAPGMSNVYPGGRPPFGNYNPFFGNPFGQRWF